MSSRIVRRWIAAAPFALVTWLGATTPPAHADAPPLLPVQGFLTDLDGDPEDGTRDITFSLYDGPTASSALFTETQAIDVDEGRFSAYVGSVEDLDLALFEAEDELYLGIQVEDDDEISPRFQLGSVPWAAYAQMCGDASTLGGYAAGEYVRQSELTSALEDYALSSEVETDTNAGTLCDPGEYLDGDGSCKDAPVDTTLDESQVDAFVADNGYLTDAYAHLSSAGRLDNGQGTDLLTRDQLDARFVNESAAITAPSFTLSTPRQGTAWVLPADFNPRMSNEDEVFTRNDLVAISSGTSAYNLSLIATLTLPAGATTSLFRCAYGNRVIPESLGLITASSVGITCGNDEVSSTSLPDGVGRVDQAFVTTQDPLFGPCYVLVDFTVSAPDADVGLIGCFVLYEQSTL